LIKLSQLALSDGLAGENSPKIITNGKRPIYGDLVRQYIALNKAARFKKVPHGRYINFVAEFCALEKGATHREAIAAWTALKAIDIPKDYASWG
jgi:hypothetical protein